MVVVSSVTGKMVREIIGPRDQNFRGKLILGLLFSRKIGPRVTFFMEKWSYREKSGPFSGAKISRKIGPIGLLFCGELVLGLLHTLFKLCTI